MFVIYGLFNISGNIGPSKYRLQVWSGLKVVYKLMVATRRDHNHTQVSFIYLFIDNGI